jgi:transcriptional pleiotropic regulator of transition state genes
LQELIFLQISIIVEIKFKGDEKMKSTGIVRKIDDLGRMVIPIELRKTMNINKKDPMEIFVDGDKIILKKYEPACIFCGSADDIIEYEGRTICGSCKEKIAEK